MSPAPILAYLEEIVDAHQRGDFTEHTFRPCLRTLLLELLPGVRATNEPRRIECGAPDYVLTRNDIPLGYIEAKNVDRSLDDPAHKEQLQRYIQSLDNLIFTNYLEFRFYRDNKTQPVAKVCIAELHDGKIKLLPENFAVFSDLIGNFGEYQGQTITAADDLAKRMADKARLLARVITDALNADDKIDDAHTKDNELQGQLKAFREFLDTGIKPQRFAGIYAQTIAYGMFVARLHDPTPATFTRHEAARLIPGSNPFLKKFFGYIADYDLDERIRWIVDDLADIFRAANVAELMQDFGRTTQRTDPFLHFYETFLSQYDRKLRMSRGVYYTPEPAVHFIVRAVDEILQKEFHLSDGLADTSKTTVEMNGKQKEMHKVQILDPSTGTGTFLAEAMKHIYSRFVRQRGAWPNYVKNNLIPRLHGFEILMAPYAMAHVKLEMILKETGFELGGERRLQVFLTNSLENRSAETGMSEIPFANWLVNESRGADEIKRDTPVMVVMGNPPYAVSSSNTGEWIETQIKDYKQDLSERNMQPLSDDYVKFIRYGQFLINKTGEGVLAYISNNSFIDGLIHRKMRQNLLDTFDRIYILNLHGDSRKKERSPDGSPDQNVFDIMQGVSINIFVKTGKKKKRTMGAVFHSDIFGTRESKYEFLWERDFGKIKFRKLKTQSPYFFFVPKDFSAQAEYESGFSLPELMKSHNSGIKTGGDNLAVKFTHKEIEAIAEDFLSLDVATLKNKYPDRKETGGWTFASAKQDLMQRKFKFVDMLYRPFDIRRTIYATAGFISRPRHKTMKQMLVGENFGLMTSRSYSIDTDFDRILITSHIADIHAASDQTHFFPLYLYPDKEQTRLDGEAQRKLNLDVGIVKAIADKIDSQFTLEMTDTRNTFNPLNLLDYIYAALHSPIYRTKFREFLKIDFPRIPWPRDKKHFRALAKLGAELRALHLMESDKLNTLITSFPESGNEAITRRIVSRDYEITDSKKKHGKVWINDQQYFGDVPQTAWDFYIGGYQPAQKWLKDRRGRVLTWDEISHYQKIIVTLVETAAIMEKIDKV